MEPLQDESRQDGSELHLARYSAQAAALLAATPALDPESESAAALAAWRSRQREKNRSPLDRPCIVCDGKGLLFEHVGASVQVSQCADCYGSGCDILRQRKELDRRNKLRSLDRFRLWQQR